MRALLHLAAVPTLQDVSPNIDLAPSQSLDISCRASGIPPPVFTWLLDGQPLRLGDSRSLLFLCSLSHSTLFSHNSFPFFTPFVPILFIIMHTFCFEFYLLSFTLDIVFSSSLSLFHTLCTLIPIRQGSSYIHYNALPF